MDLKALKLELLERIANLDDASRLLALKSLLESPPSNAILGDHLSVVREGEASYLKLEVRMYTAEEVRALLTEVAQGLFPSAKGEGNISDEELAELDRRHAARLSGASKGFSMEESLRMLRARSKR